MKQINNTFRALISTLALIILLAFVLPAAAQNSISTDKKIVAGGEHEKTELASGNWVLTDRRMDVFNEANVTQWSGSEQNLNAVCQWKDVLSIIHTISGSFKWQEPPRSMAPGSYNKIAASYINDEYSTDNRVLLGVKVKIDNITSDYSAAGPGSIDILRLTKDNRNYSNETKTGYFTAPKTLVGESNEMVMMVDCYIGQDHYVSTYTYTWIGEESASK